MTLTKRTCKIMVDNINKTACNFRKKRKEGRTNTIDDGRFKNKAYNAKIKKKRKQRQKYFKLERVLSEMRV